jgi:hypothetical protein
MLPTPNAVPSRLLFLLRVFEKFPFGRFLRLVSPRRHSYRVLELTKLHPLYDHSDGKPYCQYDYHLLNGSLCANRSCGSPIEGPCVSLGGEENGGGGRCEYLSRLLLKRREQRADESPF